MKFEKGKSGNPGGRPRLPEDVRKAMLQDSADFFRAISKAMRLSGPELKSLANNPKTPAMELIAIGFVAKLIKEGDAQRMRFIAERLAGKVPEKIEWEGDAPVSGQQISHALIFQSIQSITKTKEGEE